MPRRCMLLLLLTGFPVQGQTPDIQTSPPPAVPLGAMVREAKNILLLETAPNAKNSQLVVLQPIAALKGKKESIRIITSGTLSQWAEKPRRQAVYFSNIGKGLLCVGCNWFELFPAGEGNWFLLPTYAPHRRSFIGSPATLVQHVRDLRAGKEVIVTVESPMANREDWFGHFGRDWLHGQHGPVRRIKTGPKDEAIEHGVLQLGKDGRFLEPAVVGEGFAPEDLPGLLRSLESKEPYVRAAAAFDIGMVQPEARGAIPALRKALQDSDPFVRLHAALSLALIEPKAAAELRVLRKALKDEDFEVRRNALGVLARLGLRGLPAFDDVLKALRDDGPDVALAAANTVRLLARDGSLPKRQRERAITALAQTMLKQPFAEPLDGGAALGARPPVPLAETATRALLAFGAETSTVIPALRDALKSDREMVVSLACDVLSRLDPPPVPILVEALDRERRPVAEGNLCAVLMTVDPGARLASPALRRRLDVAEAVSRLGLVRTLLGIEGKQELPELLPTIRLLAKDREVLVAHGFEVLLLLELYLPSLEGVEGLVRDYLKDKDVHVRLAAARLLVGAGKPEIGLPVLLRELDSKDAANRVEALACLDMLGPKASAALPKLRKLAEDAKHPSRLDVLTALWRVEDRPLDARQQAIVSLQQRQRNFLWLLRYEPEEGLYLGGTFRTSVVDDTSLKTALDHFARLLLSDERAGDRIGEALKSRHPALRLSAVMARLAMKEPKEVVPALVELFQESPDYFWCVSDDVAALGQKARQLSPFLRRQLTSDNSMLYLAARNTLKAVDPAALKGVWPIADLEPLALSEKELERCWQELADRDQAKAYLAECRLIRGGDRAVASLSQRLLPAVSVEREKLARLLADLESKRFAERERAAGELQKLGHLVEPALRKLLDDKPPLELRRRVDVLLERLDPMRCPQRLREWRAVEVLEHIGSEAAREHLRKLAGGATGAPLTQDAKAALERYGK